MKYLTSTLLILCLITLTTSFSPQKQAKVMKKQGFVFVPSGATTVDGINLTINGFYMQAGEVTNKEYRTFLEDLKAKGKTAEYEVANVQSEKWILPFSSLEEMKEHYFTHPAFDNYPVVNISQQAARLYCTWLEEQLKANGVGAKVRLPEKAEWVYAAHGGIQGSIYPWEGNELRNKKGIYLANYKTSSLSEDGAYMTAISKSYFPNGFDLYNMSGNVSEWISTDGETKGGNWWSEPEYLRIDAAQEFPYSTEASPFIGFRTVVTVTSLVK